MVDSANARVSVRRAAGVRIVGVILGLLATAAVASGPNRLYRNDGLRVRAFEAPPGWRAAPQSSYPGLLVLLNHDDGSRLTLTAQKLAGPMDAQTLALRARDALTRHGFGQWKEGRDTRDAARARLSGSFDGGHRQLRQVYVVDHDLGYVVTLMTATSDTADRLNDFEAAAHSLIVGTTEREHLDVDGGLPR